jgi:hypothetical protein
VGGVIPREFIPAVENQEIELWQRKNLNEQSRI